MKCDIDDETALLFLEGSLPSKDNKSYEEHLVTCKECQERIIDLLMTHYFASGHFPNRHLSSCPDDETISLYLAGVLDEKENSSVKIHFQSCPFCTAHEIIICQNKPFDSVTSVLNHPLDTTSDYQGTQNSLSNARITAKGFFEVTWPEQKHNFNIFWQLALDSYKEYKKHEQASPESKQLVGSLAIAGSELSVEYHTIVTTICLILSVYDKMRGQRIMPHQLKQFIAFEAKRLMLPNKIGKNLFKHFRLS
jgi:hypothetical protein